MPKFNLLIQIENEKETLFIYEILGGKPNNKLLPSEQTFDQRVLRPQQKGFTCYYYATRILANRIGKHPDVQNTEERKIERMLSSARKEMTLNKLRDNACNLLLDYAKDFDKNSNSVNIAWVKSKQSLINGTVTEKQEFVAAVEDFAVARNKQQNLRFQAFIEQRCKNNLFKAKLKGLAHLGIDFENEIKKHQGVFRKELELDTKIEHNDEHFNCLMSDAIHNHAQLKLEKFIPLHWAPTSSFKDLSDHLKENGPIFATGLYGKLYYDEKSDHRLPLGEAKLKTGKTAKIEAQYWKAEERLTGSGLMGHAVIVVGVYAKGSANLVLFVDPADSSKANQPSKLYAMSYKTFCEHAAVTNMITNFTTDNRMGYIYAAPPQPDNPKLRIAY